jgi:alpha-tubulin suppressor-like RCC1 family protein
MREMGSAGNAWRARSRASVYAVAALTASLAALAVAAPAGATVGASAWGYNAYGELGNGSTERSTVPVAVTGVDSRIAAIDAGATHSLALSKDGTVRAWGANEYGQDGDGTSTGPEECSFNEPCSMLAVPVTGLEGAIAVSAGGAHNLALLSDGTVVAWGANGKGQLGNGTDTGPETCSRFPFQEACKTTPAPVSGLSEVVAVSAGAQHSLALLKNGHVMAWGYNESGELGDGTTTERDAPVEVSGLSGVVAISAGYEHSLALLSNGTVKAWGRNFAGQLGNGTTVDGHTPVPVSGLTEVVAIAGGGQHSLALLRNGTVKSWGSNGNSQLGNAFAVLKSTTPVEVTGLKEVTAIEAGLAHSLALESDGTAMAWGWNDNGQIGNGTIGEDQPAPTPVTTLSGATMISGGAYYSLAYSPPPPTVTAVVPAEGPQAGGTSVTISGTEFTGASAVKFGESEAASFKVISDTSITATSPAGSETVDVTVTNAVGTSATSAADHFTYVHTAAEDLPEFGQCMKVSDHKGAFTRPNCLPESPTHTGSYEWVPGPPAKSTISIPVRAVTLRSANVIMTCSSGLLSGEISGRKTVSLSVTYIGCHDITNKPCQSSPTETGVVSTAQALEGVLGFIRSGTRPRVGLDLKPKSPATSLLSFDCREGVEVGSHVLVEGAVIGQDKTINRMSTSFKLLYKASGTKQIPEKFETGVKETLTTSVVTSGGSSGPDAAGLTMLGFGVNYIIGTAAEAFEVKAKL